VFTLILILGEIMICTNIVITCFLSDILHQNVFHGVKGERDGGSLEGAVLGAASCII
jgi:hypothetical protein